MSNEVVSAPQVLSAAPADTFPPAETELKYGFRAYVVARCARLISIACVSTAAVLIVGTLGWTVVETSRALSGRTTSIEARVNVDVNAKAEGKGGVELSVPQLEPISKLLSKPATAWTIMGLCVFIAVTAALKARRRRRDTIAQFAPFRKRYESESDPLRSSSELTERGDAQKEE